MRLLRSDLSVCLCKSQSYVLASWELICLVAQNLCLRSIWAFLLDSTAHFCFSGFYTFCVVFSSWFYSDDDEGISVYLNRELHAMNTVVAKLQRQFQDYLVSLYQQVGFETEWAPLWLIVLVWFDLGL